MSEEPYPTIIELTEKLEQEFQPFFNEMINELIRHYPKNGDSWKACNMKDMKWLLNTSMDDWFGNTKNVSHLVDVANFCAFYYLRHYDTSPTELIE